MGKNIELIIAPFLTINQLMVLQIRNAEDQVNSRYQSWKIAKQKAIQVHFPTHILKNISLQGPLQIEDKARLDIFV